MIGNILADGFQRWIPVGDQSMRRFFGANRAMHQFLLWPIRRFPAADRSMRRIFPADYLTLAFLSRFDKWR